MSSIYSTWVKARYTGERAKSVIAHAEAGLGYVILERPDKGSAWVVVAFRRASGLLPHGAEEIRDPRMIARLEQKVLPAHMRQAPAVSTNGSSTVFPVR